ncbi:HET-domain-containing protein [Colletotrichum asianum]
MSVLCKQCEVIRLNDAEHNGFVQVAKSGKTYLGFEFQESTGRLFLEYELKDSFPDLPVLSRSSLKGCILCTLLKDEITKFRTETWRSIQQQTDLFIHKLLYSMSYTGESDEVLHRYSLEALLVHFKLSHPTNPDDQSSHALRLDIQAEPTGKHLPLSPESRD